MDSITYDCWIDSMKKEELTSQEALIATLEPLNGPELTRRVEKLMERADALGYSQEFMFAMLRGYQDDLNYAEDKLSYIRKQMGSRLINTALRSLQNRSYESPQWVVEDLLPTGLCILAAPPKSGKSWFALDLCMAVSQGKPFLNLPSRKCSALYLALEDTARRLKERTDLLTGHAPCPEGIDIVREVAGLKNGLQAGLEEYLESRPETGLIIIDTLQKVRGVRSAADVYGADYEDLSILKRIADRFGVCILVLHHTRKNTEADDPFETISGSNGIAGTADTELVLLKNRRSEADATLHITGRDVKERELALRFSDTSHRWLSQGDGKAVRREIRRQELERDPISRTAIALASKGPWQGTTGDFLNEMEALGNLPQQHNLRSISLALRKLRDDLTMFGVQLDVSKAPNQQTLFRLCQQAN